MPEGPEIHESVHEALAAEAVVVGDGADNLIGVHGTSKGNIGVQGDSQSSNGVFGLCGTEAASGVYGQNDAGGYGVAGRSRDGVGVLGEGGRLAGLFNGDVEVTGDIRLTGADLAEDFDTEDGAYVEPGTVVVIGRDEALQPCLTAYDRRVAGVVSGAGAYRPGIVLDRRSGTGGRVQVALTGKVYCQVDARYGAVDVGDLLTTSDTPGHAMKVTDPVSAFGSVLGKALRPLASGRGTIPILVALQ